MFNEEIRLKKNDKEIDYKEDKFKKKIKHSVIIYTNFSKVVIKTIHICLLIV